MNIDFLKEVAKDILTNYSSELHQLQVILPNRRAGQYLLRHLAEESQKPVWSPQILSIEEFQEQFTDLKRADNLLLIFKLYPLYQQLISGAESFDQFYSWAEIILRDFNSLDQQCADTEKVFHLLQDFKELDGDDLFSDEQKDALNAFYENLNEENNSSTSHKQKFLDFWRVLPKLYNEFTKKLTQEGIGYSGLIARQAIEKGSFEGVLGNKKVLFCGFNALTKAEESLIKLLVKKGKARIIWDVDKHILKPEQEAGLFMRRWIRDEVFKTTFPAAIPDRLSKKLKENIKLVELPLEHVQAREVGRQLQDQLESEGVPSNQQLTRTAIVLPDESQLFPLLYQIPPALENSIVNVTMGVPIKVTPVYSLIENLLDLQKTCNTNGLEHLFHVRSVTSLLRHPYVKGLDPDFVGKILYDIEKRDQSYICESSLKASEHLAPIFHCAEKGKGTGKYLLEILELFRQQIILKQDTQITLEEEYISRTHTQLGSFLETVIEANIELSADLLEKLIRHLLQQLKVPFKGDPLNGLQIMGMLETRCLDFDNLYILSVNEGIMPAAANDTSLIPHIIRNAYGLPTTDEHDAVYAYNFYRLLLRADKVHLFYSSYHSEGKVGEVSRFVKQLIYELWPEVKPQQLYLKAKPASTLPLSIKKEDVASALQRYVDNGKPGEPLSASALNTWLHCKMQFAFRYLLELKEPDEVQEDIDGSIFGNLMHEVLRCFYKDKEGYTVTRESIDQKLQDTSVLDRVMKAYQKNLKVELSLGRNSFPVKMVAKMVEQVLEIDKAYAPFKIIKLEEEYMMPIEVPSETGSNMMNIRGFIDRIDEKDGAIRIIDYKTGGDERSFTTITDLFDREKPKRNKAAMQVLLYSLLYIHSNKEETKSKLIVPAMYNRKELYKEQFNAKLLMDKSELLYLTDSLRQETDQELKKLLSDIVNPKSIINQRKQDSGCDYCDYTKICGKVIEQEKY
jgi:ATP-dependent helicase/DNAse subunit B